jgi:hypothetical protein
VLQEGHCGRVEKTTDVSAELMEERAAAVRVNRMRGEMLLAKARGELIERALVEKQAAFLFIAMRQKMLSAPQTYARELVGITDARVMADKLRAMMLNMLNELRNMPQRVTDPHCRTGSTSRTAKQPKAEALAHYVSNAMKCQVRASKVADDLSQDSKLFQYFLVSHPKGTTMIGHLARFKVLVTTLLLKRWYSTP